MNKQILNGVGWTLLFTAFALVPSVSLDSAHGRVATLLVLICAASSVPLLWFGGYKDRCKSVHDSLSKCRASMNKRILNGVGWGLLFTAFVLVPSVSLDSGHGRVATLLVLICAVSSVPLFWFGGYKDRCKSAEPDGS